MREEVGSIYGENKKQLAVPALEVARKEMHPRVFNVIILGVLMRATGFLQRSHIEQALERTLGHKFARNPSLRELNYRALEEGCQMAEGGATAASGAPP